MRAAQRHAHFSSESESSRRPASSVRPIDRIAQPSCLGIDLIAFIRLSVDFSSRARSFTRVLDSDTRITSSYVCGIPRAS